MSCLEMAAAFLSLLVHRDYQLHGILSDFELLRCTLRRRSAITRLAVATQRQPESQVGILAIQAALHISSEDVHHFPNAVGNLVVVAGIIGIDAHPRSH